MITSRKIFLSPLMAGLLACSALTLGGCGLNREPPPRYNTVVGEKRPPVLNPEGQGYSGLPYASAPPYPIPPGPPPYPTVDEVPLEDTVSVVPSPHTPQTMAGMEAPHDQRAQMSSHPMPAPQEERSWYSGITDLFGGGDEDAVAQQEGLPRKAPQENLAAYEEQHGVSAMPIPDVASSDMPAPMPESEPTAMMTEIPADNVAPTPMPESAPAPMAAAAPADGWQPVDTSSAAPQMTTDSQGYPVLAETPPSPEDQQARLAEAQAKIQAMEAEQAAVQQARTTQESYDQAYAPASAAPMPEAPMPQSVTTAPASQWRPVGEPMPAPQPEPLAEAPQWQPVAPAAPAPTAAQPMPVYQPEQVQVVQDVPAGSVAAADGLPPITLMPPPSAASPAAPVVARGMGTQRYIAPSRYEQRKAAQKLSPFRTQ